MHSEWFLYTEQNESMKNKNCLDIPLKSAIVQTD